MENKIGLSNSLWIIGIIITLFFTYIKFDPTTFLRILITIMLSSTFGLLGIFASKEIRKTIKEHYERNTKNTWREIQELRIRQENKEIEEQIKIEEEILELIKSLKGFKRDYFEGCVRKSAILFSITLLTTFIDFGSYINIPSLVVMIFFSFWGLFYFCRMIQVIFIALNIVKLD